MSIKSFIRKVLNKLHFIRIVRVQEVSRPYSLTIQSKDRFKGQLAVVTGGSGVIGRAICYRLASEGAKVIVCGSNLERINKTVDEIRKDGFLAEPCQYNLLDAASIKAAFDNIKERFCKLDLLVTCAGGGAREEMRAFIDQKIEVIDNILMMNLRGSMLCVQQACRQMVAGGGGNIVMISSTVGLGGMPRYSEYAAAKAGVNAFMKSIAMEYGKDGIRCNCVSPGIVQRGTIDEIKLENIAKTNWLGSYGKPEDISGMVAYLNSEEASFITGQNFVVDGGRSLGLKGQTG